LDTIGEKTEYFSQFFENRGEAQSVKDKGEERLSDEIRVTKSREA
jgi:hypothetical protein